MLLNKKRKINKKIKKKRKKKIGIKVKNINSQKKMGKSKG